MTNRESEGRVAQVSRLRQVTGCPGEPPPLNLARFGPDPIHNVENPRFQANVAAEPGTPRRPGLTWRKISVAEMLQFGSGLA
jgi:hypothetical protein